METASSLTDRDYRDNEEDVEELEIRAREDTPVSSEQIPFPPVEENVPKLRVWLVKKLSSS